MTRAALVLGATMVLAMAACGTSAADRLATVADGVDRIDRGVLDMRLSIASISAPETPIGFELEGPFDVSGDDVEADLTYRQIAGSADEEVRFIAADGRAFVEMDGSSYEIPVQEQPAQAAAPTMLRDLSFDRWAASPTAVEGDDGTIMITSPLDEVAALEGLSALLDSLGMREAAGFTAFDELDDEALRRAVRSGSMAVRVGPNDVLRTLEVSLRFGVDPSSPLGEALQDVAGADLRFVVDIAEPDGSIAVAVPTDAQPISELPAA